MSMTISVFAVPPPDMDRILNDPSFFAEWTRYGNESVTSVSLEKSWHGLHYLLTGDAWDTNGPKAFLIFGGSEVPESDAGYGSARLFSPSEAARIHAELSSVGGEELWSGFDAQKMMAQEIYPTIWDEPESDLKEEYLYYYNDLKNLVANVKEAGSGLLVFLA